MRAPASEDGREVAVPGDGVGLAVQGAAHLVAWGDLYLAFRGHPRIRLSAGWSSDPLAIAAAIDTSGADALRAIGGDFALAAWSRARKRGLLAVDRIGVRQLVYARAGRDLAFASSLDALIRHPKVSRELSPQALYDYLYFHVCPGPGTIYRDAQRMPPAHYIEFGPDREPEPRPYWSMRFREDRRPDFEALKERLVFLLQGAVAVCASGARSGAFLSGGTDSSTVSGMLGRVNGARPPTFSIGFDVAGYDEMRYARIAARHFDCDHHEYYVTPADVVAAAPKIAAHFDQPFGNASAIPVFYCARLARDSGVERLLAGDGGDELFGGNERYAKQYLLGLYDRLPRSLRASLIEPLVLATPLFRTLPVLKKVHSYVRQASFEMPARYAAHNLLTHLGPEVVLTRDFLSAVDTDHPQKLLVDAHAPFSASSLINQMLGIDLRFTLADNDLPKVTRACELAGVDVAFPMLDEDILEFSAALPAHFKLRGTTLRWFFKEALRDFLPPQIITKRKHGFGLPVGAWLVSYGPLRALADEAIYALRPHRIVRPKFIDDVCRRLLPSHPAYYGTMVWLLAMLGLWLRAKLAA
ncbi:MAG: asparagine synthetase B family protein [Burkholderiaceae bacterium]|nr:asparagine synthetase B family protein [Burkholderiaceae bacterium]